jgi:hypothetical protein
MEDRQGKKRITEKRGKNGDLSIESIDETANWIVQVVFARTLAPNQTSSGAGYAKTVRTVDGNETASDSDVKDDRALKRQKLRNTEKLKKKIPREMEWDLYVSPDLKRNVVNDLLGSWTNLDKDQIEETEQFKESQDESKLTKSVNKLVKLCMAENRNDIESDNDSWSDFETKSMKKKGKQRESLWDVLSDEKEGKQNILPDVDDHTRLRRRTENKGKKESFGVSMQDNTTREEELPHISMDIKVQTDEAELDMSTKLEDLKLLQDSVVHEYSPEESRIQHSNSPNELEGQKPSSSVKGSSSTIESIGRLSSLKKGANDISNGQVSKVEDGSTETNWRNLPVPKFSTASHHNQQARASPEDTHSQTQRHLKFVNDTIDHTSGGLNMSKESSDDNSKRANASPEPSQSAPWPPINQNQTSPPNMQHHGLQLPRRPSHSNIGKKQAAIYGGGNNADSDDSASDEFDPSLGRESRQSKVYSARKPGSVNNAKRANDIYRDPKSLHHNPYETPYGYQPGYVPRVPSHYDSPYSFQPGPIAPYYHQIPWPGSTYSDPNSQDRESPQLSGLGKELSVVSSKMDKFEQQLKRQRTDEMSRQRYEEEMTRAALDKERTIIELSGKLASAKEEAERTKRKRQEEQDQYEKHKSKTEAVIHKTKLEQLSLITRSEERARILEQKLLAQSTEEDQKIQKLNQTVERLEKEKQDNIIKAQQAMTEANEEAKKAMEEAVAAAKYSAKEEAAEAIKIATFRRVPSSRSQWAPSPFQYQKVAGNSATNTSSTTSSSDSDETETEDSEDTQTRSALSTSREEDEQLLSPSVNGSSMSRFVPIVVPSRPGWDSFQEAQFESQLRGSGFKLYFQQTEAPDQNEQVGSTSIRATLFWQPPGPMAEGELYKALRDTGWRPTYVRATSE